MATTSNKYIVLPESSTERKQGESWRETLDRWMVRCPQCHAQWLVVGARENDRYVCKDCGHGFPIKFSSGEEELIRVAEETYANRDFKILLATDASGASLAASQLVADTDWPKSTEVKVVSVVNPVTYSLGEIGLLRDKGTDRAHRAIGQALQVLKNSPVKITGEVLAGGIVRAIVDRARSWGADLIVLGTRDRRGLKRLFLNSISAAVVRRAHCSVRVVRHHGVSQDEELSSRAA